MLEVLFLPIIKINNSLKKNKCGYIDYMMQHLKSSVIFKLQSRTLHSWGVLNE